MARIRIRRRGQPDPAECWATRPTPGGRSAPTCGDAGSRPPSPSAPVNRPAGCVGAATAVGHHGSTPEIYKQPNTIECTINKFKGYRAVATRHDKRDYMIREPSIASIRIWLSDPVPCSTGQDLDGHGPWATCQS
jgi:transposase